MPSNSDTSQLDIDCDHSSLLSQSDDTELNHSDSRTYRKFRAENLKPSTSKVGDSDLSTQSENIAPVVRLESMS